MRKGRDSAMSEAMVLNSSVGSTKVLIVSVIVVFMGIAEGISMMFIFMDPKGSRQWN